MTSRDYGPVAVYYTTLSGGTAQYSYGPAARRVRKDVDGTGTDFVHAGAMEIAEYDTTSGALLRRYIPGPGIDQRVAAVECGTGAGAAACVPGGAGVVTRHYAADRQGNVLAVLNANGTLHQRFAYTPFGVEMQGDPSGNPFRYTGRRYDPETGLYYYRARYYDADLGRFLQVDPIGYADQWNLYAYVGNNPLNATDPSGMCGTRLPGKTSFSCSGETVLGVISGSREGLQRAVDPPVRHLTQCEICERYGREEPLGDAARRAMGQDIPERDPLFDPRDLAGTLDWFYMASANAGGGFFLRSGGGLSRSSAVGRSVAARASSRDILISARQLQRKFKHASDFGVAGNANRATLAQYAEAVGAHVQHPSTRVIQGTYRGGQATHFYNSGTGVNVIRGADGQFVSGWRLSTDQLINLLNRGSLGGG